MLEEMGVLGLSLLYERLKVADAVIEAQCLYHCVSFRGLSRRCWSSGVLCAAVEMMWRLGGPLYIRNVP